MTPDEHYARLALATKLLIGVVLLIWALQSPVTWIGDCHKHFGLVDCTLAYGASWVD